MKKVSTILTLFFASVFMLTLSSCGDSSDGLSGWYVSSGADNGGGGAYNFVSSKNVEVYTSLYPYRYSYPDWMKNNIVTVKGTKYRYNYKSNYTYTYKDGVIYIPMAGQMLNKSGNTLRRDGSSDTFIKR